MTIQEAIQSGKPFKRPSQDFWAVIFQGFFYIYQEEPTTKMLRMLVTMTGKKAAKKPNKWHKLKTKWLPGEVVLPKQTVSIPIMFGKESILATDWEVKL